jgi:hypothetical protein
VIASTLCSINARKPFSLKEIGILETALTGFLLTLPGFGFPRSGLVADARFSFMFSPET